MSQSSWIENEDDDQDDGDDDDYDKILPAMSTAVVVRKADGDLADASDGE